MTQRKNAPALWPLIVLFFVIALGSIITALIYYNNQKIAFLQEKEKELSSISYLKDIHKNLHMN